MEDTNKHMRTARIGVTQKATLNAVTTWSVELRKHVQAGYIRTRMGGAKTLERTGLALRAAAQRESRQAESTTQAQKAASSYEPTIQASTSSRPLAPPVFDVNAPVPPKIPKKKKKASAEKSTQ
jgi:hypothetical protein